MVDGAYRFNAMRNRTGWFIAHSDGGPWGTAGGFLDRIYFTSSYRFDGIEYYPRGRCIYTF